ncbi:MAG TPA: peptidoglycan editing factor PgeF [Candidatus Sulfotelmatobacter sp.]|jgi:YfiH family protein|nr:peptidoglycan editing factor PgeF [Candidatus Sulfotelmatobacter sp.]
MKDDIYQFQKFLKSKNVIHGVSTKAFGSMKRLKDQTDRESLEKFAKKIGITGDIVCMQQIHSGSVVIIENTNELRIAETDGLLTNKKNISLAVLTADCLPILFYDPRKEVIGIAHAGYKGLLNHIIENMISNFVSYFKSDSKDIIVGIGPSIETICYQVSVELLERFQEAFPSFENIFVEKDEKFFLDLRGIAQQCLMKDGIVKEHIEIMDICTKSDPNFYSYRGGDKNDRFVSIISLL